MRKHIVDDVNVKSIKPLIKPSALLKKIPITENAVKSVCKTRESIKNIVHGTNDRLLVIIGPCSIHNIESALEYGNRLKQCINSLENDLCIVMRVYFEKPRTSIGWKGLINDPGLDGSFEINKGLHKARQLLLDLNNAGIPTATEFLDTTIPQFISDLISWGAIGARTTESQIHRELASGLSMPIGFKNSTDCNVDIAIDATKAAKSEHHFLGITKSSAAAIIHTSGNKNCHIILRGGKKKTNYDKESISLAISKLKENSLPGFVMVDCSHDNCKKDHNNQINVIDDIVKQIKDGSNSIIGVMIESNLLAGNQSFAIGKKLNARQSITDPCISWEQTETVLNNLAEAVKKRRENE